MGGSFELNAVLACTYWIRRGFQKKKKKHIMKTRIEVYLAMGGCFEVNAVLACTYWIRRGFQQKKNNN